MQEGIELVVRLFITLMLAIISVCSQRARAECSLTNLDTNPTVTFTMPAQIAIESDTAVRAIVCSGETVGESHGPSCDGNERVYDDYLVSTDTGYPEILPGVYKTTVPGIDFHAARTENRTATFTGDNLVTPQHYIGGLGSWTSFDSTYHVGVRLAVIDTVQSGTLDTNLFNADYQMGNLIAAKLRFGPTVVDVLTNTCNLVSKDITVLMDSITSGSLSQGYSSVFTDGSFKTEVADCTTGTHIDYRFISTGSTGATSGNTLSIASGEGAANDMGIQILDKDSHVLSFDQEYTGIKSATGRGTGEIPPRARYAKTGTVKGGRVDAVATFEAYYR